MSSSNQYGRFEFVINGSNQLIVTDLPPTVCLAKNHPQALLYIVVMITGLEIQHLPQHCQWVKVCQEVRVEEEDMAE